MKKNKSILLGAHMSIAGGLEKSIQRGESIGCTAIQIFTKSCRQLFGKVLTDEQISLFKETFSASSIEIVVAHAGYLINLGSAEKAIAQQSVNALIEELCRCDQLEIPYLIVHPGSHLGMGREKCLEQIIKHIDIVLNRAKPKTMLLLETMAGQGTSVCNHFEDIATIIDSCKFPNNIGVCLDTCHTFVAGYDFRDTKTYHSMWAKFDNIIGLDKLKVIHINDSKKDLGSQVDRHETLGKGKLGLEPFRLIINDERFLTVPKILETPKLTIEDDRDNIQLVRKLVK